MNLHNLFLVIGQGSAFLPVLELRKVQTQIGLVSTGAI